MKKQTYSAQLQREWYAGKDLTTCSPNIPWLAAAFADFPDVNNLTMADFKLQPDVSEYRLTQKGDFREKNMESDSYWCTKEFCNK